MRVRWFHVGVLSACLAAALGAQAQPSETVSAAEAGQPVAQFELGSIYFNGKGAERNPRRHCAGSVWRPSKTMPKPSTCWAW
jgi:TPR repeat protein